MMTPEWVSAIVSLLTLVVVGASAAAALVQLRHMRGANQITALNEMRENVQTESFQKALRFVYRELPKSYDDPHGRSAVVSTPLPEEYQPAYTVGNFFENVGLLVKRRVVDGNIIADMWGKTILTSWARMAPLITNRRYANNQPQLLENFEYLAVFCTRFKERHGSGTYPKGFPRMPETAIWNDASSGTLP